MKNVLIIVAHPDDEILGVGGTAARIVKEGGTVKCLILGQGQMARIQVVHDSSVLAALRDDARRAAGIIGCNDIYFEDFPDNRFDSVDMLDIVQRIERYIQDIAPDTIFTHYGNDLNVDHRICFEAVLTATRPTGSDAPRELFAFETLSSTEWNFAAAFRPHLWMDISDFIQQKLDAMNAYTTELREPPHPRSLDIIEATARKWGSVCGVRYAEAFEVVRIIR